MRPSDTWVFMDEEPTSINDSAFAVAITLPGDATANTEPDIPAGYHGNATGMSFADGHSTIHRWVSKLTTTPTANKTAGYQSNPGFITDMKWLSDQSSVP